MCERYKKVWIRREVSYLVIGKDWDNDNKLHARRKTKKGALKVKKQLQEQT